MDMPQPTFVREKEAIRTEDNIGDNVFLRRPEIAAVCMECLRISTKIDHQLRTIFMMVLSDTQAMHGKVNHHFGTIYGNFISFRTKFDMVSEMMTKKGYSSAEQMSGFYRKHKSAFSKRNIIAHANWSIWDADRYDDGVVEGMSGYPESYWKLSDFESAKSQLVKAFEEICDIHDHTQVDVHNRVSENLQELAVQARYRTTALSEEQLEVLREVAKNATILKTRSAK
jgi:hypothetical protein